ncbi:glycosyltransferase family 2 protein [Chloroflexales bacterium ZM16-3]|nr:glycosyltransferase family 2 protein [Chloroflexales bacterium ZM16-3]
MPTLAIIIVSWNVRELLRRCLRSVEESLTGSDIAHEVIVVDNASADGTPEMLRTEFPEARLIEPGANLGFAAGNNLALAGLGLGVGDWGLGVGHTYQLPTPNPQPPTPDYVLLLNPDTEVVGDAIAQLVAELESRPELVAVGPRLRYGDGSVQSSRRRFPTRLSMLWESTPLERAWPGNPWARRYRCEDVPDDVAQPVGWLVGAALLVRSSAIARAGLLDERFFMYSEELEWQCRLQIADCRLQIGSAQSAIYNLQSTIVYLPEAEIIHYEGKSSEQAITRRHVSFQRSKLLLARMWFGWGFANMLRAALRMGYAYEIAAEAGKLAIGHRPDLRRQRIGVYRQVLREL